jgi:hypothetical protein
MGWNRRGSRRGSGQGGGVIEKWKGGCLSSSRGGGHKEQEIACAMNQHKLSLSVSPSLLTLSTRARPLILSFSHSLALCLSTPVITIHFFISRGRCLCHCPFKCLAGEHKAPYCRAKISQMAWLHRISRCCAVLYSVSLLAPLLTTWHELAVPDCTAFPSHGGLIAHAEPAGPVRVKYLNQGVVPSFWCDFVAGCT